MAYVSRIAKGEPLTYEEMDGNFLEMDAQFVAAEGYALDAQGSAIAAQNAADSAQSIIDDAVEQYEFAVEDNANRIRNLEYGDGPYPSLDLLFTGARMIDPRIEFERATPATYWDEMGVLRTAGPNEPRIDYDPATGECRGLLVEGQATNLALWSQDFSKSVWVATPNLVVDPDSRPSPVADGCFLLRHTGGGSFQHFRQPVPTGQGAVAVRWIVARGGASRVRIRHYTNGLTDNLGESDFNFDTGAFTSNALGVVAKSLADGWWELTYSVTHEAGTTDCSSLIYPGMLSAQTDADSIYLAAYSVETGPIATSYIPTEASQVTRASENVEIRGEAFTSWFNPAGGTFVFDRGEAPYAGNRFTLAVGKDSSHYLGLDFSQAFAGFFQPFSGGAIASSNADPSDPHRYAISWEVLGPNAVQVAVARDGAILANNTYPGDTSTINEWDVLQLGQRFGSYRAAQLYVKRLSYYPRALTNAELEALTS